MVRIVCPIGSMSNEKCRARSVHAGGFELVVRASVLDYLVKAPRTDAVRVSDKSVVQASRGMAAPGKAKSGFVPIRRAVSRGRVASLRWRLAIWVLGSAIGVAVLALPDRGPRLVSFSAEHGPTTVDAVGIVVLVGAWLPIAWFLWTGRRWLATSAGRVCGVVALVGIALLVVTIAFDLGRSWLVGVVLVVAAQAWALTGVAHASVVRRPRAR